MFQEISKITFIIVKCLLPCLQKCLLLKISCEARMIFMRAWRMPPDKSAYWKIIFLHLNQNICCGYSGSFEHPKHMFKLMGKEINAIFGAQTILFWTYGGGMDK